MSTARIYTEAELRALLALDLDAVLPPIRVPGELAEIVARHAEARGETLSAFLRRAMVHTLHADQVRSQGEWVRAQTDGAFFEDEDDTETVGAGRDRPAVDQPQTEA